MILDDLVEVTKLRLDKHKAEVSLTELQAQCEQLENRPKYDFEASLKQPGLHIIGELKQASPSKGQIVAQFPYLTIAKDYEKAHIDAISVLTEPDYFKGHLQYLKQVSAAVQVPTLRKDFTIDPYMIYEAKANGASIILLIVAILTDTQLKEYLQLAHRLGLATIVEVHDEAEVQRALKVGAGIIGINNRNLKNFTVNFNNSSVLRQKIPAGIPVIAESGVKTLKDVKQLKQDGFNAVLIGETLMKAKDRVQLIEDFKGA